MPNPTRENAAPSPRRARAATAGGRVAVLRRNHTLGGLDRATLARLARACEEVDLPAGAVLLREGEAGADAYVVAVGRLQITRSDGHRSMLGPGALCGELSMLRGAGRSATVTAVRASRVLRIAGDAFRQAVRGDVDAALRLAGRLAEEVAERRAPTVPAAVRTIAVVAAGGAEGRHVARVARAVTTDLGRRGRARLVTRRFVAASLGPEAPEALPGTPAAGRVAELLQRAEDGSTHLVLQGDEGDSEWSRRCVRQADAVLQVAAVDVRPSPGGLDAEVAQAAARGARVHLALVRADGRPPSAGTWLRDRSAVRHHHVRLSAPADVARLARALSGRSLGVVLGGGGPRGFAHLGVLQALEEAGLPVDTVGGTSMGAIVGAGCARGWDHEARVEAAVDSFVRTRLLVRPTLPLASLMSARTLTRLLQRSFGDLRIEDLPLPFFCVATNVTRADTVVLDRGPVWRALRASASMPGVFPPVSVDGELLVDGGVVNDLPVDVMRARIDGPVVAVDLQPEIDVRVRGDIDPAVTGLQVLARRLNPFAASIDVPGPIALLLRAKEVSSLQAHRTRLAENPADLLLRPPIEAIGALDFKAGARLVALARDHAAPLVEEWLARSAEGGAPTPA